MRQLFLGIHPVIRALLGILAGVIAGVIVMNTIQGFSPYHPPSGVTYTSGDKAYMEWVRNMPDAAWQYILASLLTGAFLSGFVTNLISPPNNYPPLIAGFVILFFGIVQYMGFANPAWVTYISCIGCFFLAWAGGQLARIKWRRH